MTPIELIAVLFGLLYVWLAIHQSILCWVAGFVQVTLYVVIFFEAKLYSDMGLHLFYMVLSVYGFWVWFRGGSKEAGLPVRFTSTNELLGWLVLGIASTAGLGLVMKTQTDASLPYWDAGTTIFSLIATAFVAWKRWENWPLWIAIDAVAAGVYWVKGLYLTVGLYLLFMVMAIWGARAWYENHRVEQKTPSFGDQIEEAT